MSGGGAGEGKGEGAPIANPFLASFLALLFPGLGHLFLGRKIRALIFGILILTAISVGCALSGNLYTPIPGRPLSRLATIGAMGMGAPYFVLQLFLDYSGDIRSQGYDYGTAFLLSAGLMNLLLVLDAWDIASGHKE